MSNAKLPFPALNPEPAEPESLHEVEQSAAGGTHRRSFLKGIGMAGATITASALLAGKSRAQSKSNTPLSAGDTAILRFLAAAEIIESDLWTQYAELGGVSAGAQNPYQLALQVLDGDGSQYISSNTLDEISHANFLNAYLKMKGAPPVNFNKFRTLPGSTATGSKKIPRLTNLMNLTVDTSWYTRYRSKTNPDFGATFPQPIDLIGVTAIPRDDSDFAPPKHIQAIANTAAFHFGFIGRVVAVSISHGAKGARCRGTPHRPQHRWRRDRALPRVVDFSGNGVQTPVAPFTDPTNGTHLPRLQCDP